jgi:TRAP-type C4-dicarboxylate transport system substrate-binding protein
MRIKYWLILTLTMVMIAAFLFPGCEEATSPTGPPITIPSKPQPERTVILKLAYDMAPTASIALGMEHFAKEAENNAAGGLQFDIYPSSTLFGMREARDSILAGVADITVVSASVFMKNFPLYQIPMYPGIGFPTDTVEDMEASYAAHMKYIDKFPKVQDEFKDFKVLWISVLGNYTFVSNKEIRVPDDLNGMKVGGTGVKGELAKASGAATVPLPPPEIYMNMKTGVINVAWLNFTQVFDYKVWEIAEYFLDSQLGGSTAMVICMNWDSWNNLSPELQKVLEETAPAGRLRCHQGTIEVSNEGKKEAKAAGKNIYSITAEESALWQAKSEPLWDQWVESVNAQGADGQAMLDYWLELRAAYKK